MKNKKGIAILKTILYISILILFSILVIYIINYIKNKNKVTTTKENIKMVENIEYNPLNNIYDYYVYGYKNANAAQYSYTNTNSYNYENNSNVYVFAQNTNGFWNNTLMNQYPDTYLKLSYSLPELTLENTINVADILRNCHEIMYQSSGSLGSSKSCSFGLNCDIPIEYFNFTLYNNFTTQDGSTLFFNILTDVGSYSFRVGYLTFNSSTSFVGTSIYNVLPAATKVIRFGFWVVQTSNSSSNVGGYLPHYNNYAYNDNSYYTYYNSLNETQKKSLCYISFSTSTYGNEYTNGYNKGFNEGINYSSQTINSLNKRIIDLTTQINNMNTTIANQRTIIESLQAQIDGANNNFKGFFFTIADIPIRTVSNALGFEVFGVNLFQFFVGILTALGCVWLIKKLL